MGLRDWLRGEVGRRRETLHLAPGAARREPLGAIRLEAKRAAYSRLDDEAARAELLLRIEARPEVLRRAALELEEGRGDYIGDRAYRLLSAASAGTAVEPIPSEREGLFAEEEALGRMSMEEAFLGLAASEPRLMEIAGRARDLREEADVEGGLPRTVRDPLDHLLGAGADTESELLRSALAVSIAHQYLELLAGDERSGPAGVAYFDHPRKRQVGTGVPRRGRRRRSG